MPDWPVTLDNPASGTIHCCGMSSLADLVMMRKAAFTLSTAWTTANRAVYIPFLVEQTVTAQKMAVENGATLGGNLDVGIFDVNGVKLVTSGGTAQAGVSVIQVIDIADTVLTPGNYFMAMSTNSTTATYIGSQVVSGVGEYFRALGVQEQLTAYPLPTTTATFANPAATTTTIPNLCIAVLATI